MKKIGGTRDYVSFCNDVWLGLSSLELTSFPRLLVISIQKECRVLDLGRWEGDAVGI
jgi:hypothetical protein